MTDGFNEVRFIGGPWDGATRTIPDPYGAGSIFEDLDPAPLRDRVKAGELQHGTIYDGPRVRYRIEEQDGELVGVYEPN